MAGMQDATNSFPRPLLILKTGDTCDSLRAAQGDALTAADAISRAVPNGAHAMVSHRQAWREPALN